MLKNNNLAPKSWLENLTHGDPRNFNGESCLMHVLDDLVVVIACFYLIMNGSNKNCE